MNKTFKDILDKKNWHCLPLEPSDKLPAYTDNNKQYRIQWKERSVYANSTKAFTQLQGYVDTCNMGVITGKLNNIAVLDFDKKSGGLETLRRLQDEYGFPETPIVDTGGGGLHMYFQKPDGIDNDKIGLYPGVDFKCDGYVVAPGSSHKSGKFYKWRNGNKTADMPLAELPAFVIEQIKSRSTIPNIEVAEDGKVIMNTRNNSAYTAGYALASRGLVCEDTLFAMLKVFRDMAFPNPETTTDYELRQTARSSIKRALEKRIFSSTDAGNGDRYVYHHKDKVMYSAEWKSWIAHIEGKWQRDYKMHAKALANELYKLCGDSESEQKARDRLQTANAIDAMLKFAMPNMSVTLDEFDNKPYLINCLNGTYDVSTGKFEDHNRNNMLTQGTGHIYNPNAPKPVKTLAMIERATRTEEKDIAEGVDKTGLDEFCLRWHAYNLLGDTKLQYFVFIWGSGANSKSVYCDFGKHCAGKDYSMSLSTSALMVKQQEGISNDLADMKKKRMVIASETSASQTLNTRDLKAITGEQSLRARKLHENNTEFAITSHITIQGNFKPAVDGDDPAVERRMLLVPFTNTVPEAERNPNLLQELMEEETEGYLYLLCQKAREIYLDIHERNHPNPLRIPECVLQATQEYMNAQMPFGNFFTEAIIHTKNDKDFESSKDVKDAYYNWTGQAKGISYGDLKAKLDNHGVKFGGNGKAKGYRGIKLRDEYKNNVYVYTSPEDADDSLPF